MVNGFGVVQFNPLIVCTMYQLAYAKEIKTLELGLREEKTQIDTGI